MGACDRARPRSERAGHRRDDARRGPGDREADPRPSAFAGHASPMEELVRRGIGPAVMRDELEGVEEESPLDGLRFTLRLGVLAAGSIRVEGSRGEAGA